MPTHETHRGRRCSALLLASALVMLSWFAGGAAHAVTTDAIAPVVAAPAHSGSGDDGHQHVSAVDHAPRHGTLHVHQVAPDVAPAPVVQLDAPREVGVVRPVQPRGPPAAPVSTTSASRAPPA